MNSIRFAPKAAKQITKLDRQFQKSIYLGIQGLSAMPDCLNVKALTNHNYGFRLRVGNFRVLFDYDGGIKIVAIQEVKKRDDGTY